MSLPRRTFSVLLHRSGRSWQTCSGSSIPPVSDTLLSVAVNPGSWDAGTESIAGPSVFAESRTGAILAGPRRNDDLGALGRLCRRPRIPESGHELPQSLGLWGRGRVAVAAHRRNQSRPRAAGLQAFPVPATHISAVREGNQLIAAATGVKFLGTEDNCVVLAVESGQYVFAATQR